MCEHCLHVHPIPAAKPLFTLLAPSTIGDVAAEGQGLASNPSMVALSRCLQLSTSDATPDSLQTPFKGDTSLRRNFTDISSN